jgi:hypothetical protein
MTPPNLDEPRETLEDSLLRKVHEQSAHSPEPTPFWRQGRWRCEFYKQDGPPRLKVFKGEECVHEEVVQARGAVEERCRALKQTFLDKPER